MRSRTGSRDRSERPRRRRLRRRRRGAALILALGVLAVVALFGVTFVSLMRLERLATSNYVLQVNADFLARAGLAQAVTSLRDMMRPLRAGERRYTEGAFSNPGGPWVYRGFTKNRHQGGHGVPLALAVVAPPPASRAEGTRVSFERDTLLWDGPARGEAISGSLGGTLVGWGDVYALKVLDAQGMVNLNAPLPTPELRERFVALLEVLGGEVVRERAELREDLRATALPLTARDLVPPLAANPLARARVERLLALREALPAKRFSSKLQLRTLDVWSEDEFRALRDYVTCWSDGERVLPGGVPVTAPASTFGDEAPVLRYPVNLNTAPRAVIVAALSGVRARRWVVGGQPEEVLCPDAIAQRLADAVLAWRRSADPAEGRFRSWRDVQRCFETILPASGAESPEGLAVLAALVATNPHAFALGWNPDRTLWRWDEEGKVALTADKASATTRLELCFATNVYEVESLGRVLNEKAIVQAEARRTAVLRIGQTAVVRGQRALQPLDTSDESDDAPLAGPATADSDTLPAEPGWLQLAPREGDEERGPFGGAVFFDDDPLPLDAGGKTTHDGYLQLRAYGRLPDTHEPPEEQRTEVEGTGDEKLDEGTLSCWIKLPGGSAAGSDECVFYYVRRFEDATFFEPQPGAPPSAVGCAARLERHGGQLVASRFFWGRGGARDAAVAPASSEWAKGFSWTTLDVSGWAPGTWHHVALSWKVLDLALYVDGAKAPASPRAPKDRPRQLDLDGGWSAGLAPGATPPGLAQAKAPDDWLPEDSTPALVVGGFEAGGVTRWCDATFADVRWDPRFLPPSQYRRPARFGSTFALEGWTVAESFADERRELPGHLTWFALFERGDVTVFTPDADPAYVPSTTRWGGGVPCKSFDRVRLGATSAIDHPEATPFVLGGFRVQYLLKAPETLEQATELD